MDSPPPIPFPRAYESSERERDSALAEVDAAINLVLGRAAVRVRLAGFSLADVIAGPAAAHAQQAGVGFRIDRDGPRGPATITVGPLA